MNFRPRILRLSLAAIILPAAFLAGCKQDDMANQVRGKPLKASSFFANGALDRPLVPHTVARNVANAGADYAELWTATVPPDASFPFPITPNDLRRGQQRFTIYCTPCHGQLGYGNGMIPERGFLHPPSYHTDRLRRAPNSYFYNVITNGIGAMFPYNDRVAPDDRWRIVAYIRALQLSQHADVSLLSDQDRSNVAHAPVTPATGPGGTP